LTEQRQQKINILKHVVEVFSLLEAKQPLHSSQIYLNQLLTVQAIDNAFCDMERMSHFHMQGGKTPDRHKYAGFVAKWIAKSRPIQFRDNIPLNQTNSGLLGVNALFSVFVMTSFLQKTMDGHMAKHLKYWFEFREERGETLALVAYCCEK